MVGFSFFRFRLFSPSFIHSQMDGYSSLFMSGFKNQTVPRTPPHFPTQEHKNGHSSLEPPLLLATNITPSRRKAHRKRKSSISQEINPIAGLKSPTRKAGAALMNPIVEKRFLDFNTSSFAGAMNLFRWALEIFCS
jgi:hypothetical protein